MARDHRGEEDGDPATSPEDESSPGAIPDLFRRAMALGLSGFFTTEEALRKALGDNLPQDWVDFAAAQSERTRRDFADAVAGELGRVLDKVDLPTLIEHLLQNHPIEIRATIRLLPPDEGNSAGEADAPPSKTRSRVQLTVEDNNS
jgi:hypothetical protein